MKPSILIPEDVYSSTMSSDAKILYGIIITAKAQSVNIDIYSLPYINNIEKCLEEIKQYIPSSELDSPKEIKSKIKKEDWNNADIGIYVGPNNKKQYLLNGGHLKVFNNLYQIYGVKTGKRNAAWAFYSTLKPLFDSEDKDGRNHLYNKVISAAKKAKINNDLAIDEGRTPMYLQGWISSMRWEDFD